MDQEQPSFSQVNIANEVIATIACLSAMEVKGVAGMSGGVTGGFAEVLGKKNLSKGVKVEVKNNVISLHLNLIVDYGIAIPEIAWEIQDKVKNMVETMTAMKVTAVDIHVQAVKFPDGEIKEV